MKAEVYFGIAWRIIALGTVCIFATYVPENFREFFGDQLTLGCNKPNEECWTWGARHSWYAVMTGFLFILSVINIIVASVNLVNKHYPNNKL
jgi:hypothetical protein